MANSTMFESARLLVVSRERSALGLLWAIAEANGWELETAGSGWEALERVQTGTKAGVVVLDFAPGDSDGMYTLRWLRRVSPELPVIVLSRSEDEEPRREALRLGATEYLTRPLDEQLLEAVIRRCLVEREGAETNSITDGLEPLGDENFFVAVSSPMRKLRAQAELLAQVNAPLLIVGESGSGKETVARLIHRLSGRFAFRFLRIDCALFTGDSNENELFGAHRKLDAKNGRPSQFELCQRGTLLLDEISSLPLALQGRLLQILQEGHSAFPNEDGGDLDVRILATTRMNVEQAVAEGKLREDLYYRLSAFTVHVPPLRQRKEEIPIFLSYFMKHLAKRYGLPPKSFAQPVLEACQTYPWLGNIEELEAFVRQHLISTDEMLLPNSSGAERRGHLPEPLVTPAAPVEIARAANGGDGEAATAGLKSLLQNVRGETERNAIATALEQTRWNRKAAAQLLKVSYRTLLYKIQQYHMTPPDSHYSYMSDSGMKSNGRGSASLGPGAARENRS